MDNNSHHAPLLNMIISIVTTFLTWITYADAQYLMSFMLSIVGIVSGLFALRYYYYAGNEKRDIVRRNREN